MKFDITKLEWTREPEHYSINEDKIEIITKPHTDLWQRTYYHFRNDNAPVLQMATDEKYFSFVVKTEFESKHRFDQCGIVMYLDSENWLKASVEYENEGEWDLALKAYSDFLAQEDASSIQIAGEPNAYMDARQLVDFNNSPKDWTFESLEALETAVKQAITDYSYQALDRYKAKGNFVSMSWQQDTYDTNSQKDVSMRGFMRGNRIRYNEGLDEASNPNEAYLKTWGWNNYVSVWYLYFRKVNFPIDPEIHGRWEWAGVYYGEML